MHDTLTCESRWSVIFPCAKGNQQPHNAPAKLMGPPLPSASPRRTRPPRGATGANSWTACTGTDRSFE